MSGHAQDVQVAVPDLDCEQDVESVGAENSVTFSEQRLHGWPT
jgi:hypothetical protein